MVLRFCLILNDVGDEVEYTQGCAVWYKTALFCSQQGTTQYVGGGNESNGSVGVFQWCKDLHESCELKGNFVVRVFAPNEWIAAIIAEYCKLFPQQNRSELCNFFRKNPIRS